MMLKLFNLFNSKFQKPVQKKIGILYICTGKYHTFWEQFYKSCEQNFCRSAQKHYFVFSDQEVNRFGNPRVHYFFQSKLGWPYDTLKRFHIFLSQKKELEKMDYLFFFNANMHFAEQVKEEEVLPDVYRSKRQLVGVIHPCWYNKNVNNFIYERSAESKAYIKVGSGKNYYQGCLSGGTTAAYLQMCEELKVNIDADEKKGIIALWHDESHINHYFLSHPPRELNPGFAYPENMKIPFKKRILQLDKSKVGGHEFLRS